jgi:hypothetical protein
LLLKKKLSVHQEAKRQNVSESVLGSAVSPLENQLAKPAEHPRKS